MAEGAEKDGGHCAVETKVASNFLHEQFFVPHGDKSRQLTTTLRGLVWGNLGFEAWVTSFRGLEEDLCGVV